MFDIIIFFSTAEQVFNCLWVEDNTTKMFLEKNLLITNLKNTTFLSSLRFLVEQQ